LASLLIFIVAADAIVRNWPLGYWKKGNFNIDIYLYLKSDISMQLCV
jgi:hypothetical protein